MLDFNELCNMTKVTILKAESVKLSKNWNYRGMVSPFYRLYVVLDGSCLIEGDGERRELIEGYTYLIPANHRYSFSCEKSMKRLSFFFTIQNYLNTDMLFNIERITAIKNDVKLVKKLKKCIECDSYKNALRRHGYLLQILSEFVQDHYSLEIEKMKYDKVVRYINDFLSAKIRLEDMADIGVNYELSREFKRDMGMSIKVYIEQQLIAKIKELLLTTDLTIKQIAERYDFCDQYYLSRFFKKHEGISPAAYKKNNKIK